jgi:2-polyprenyl-3-methyl-5-hydroxy-6-metoxy-1,4-benzoquinol methylase
LIATTQLPAAATARSGSGCPACGHPRRAGRVATTAAAAAELIRCAGCRLVYWAQRWSPERAREHYEAYYQPDAIVVDALTARRYEALLDRLARLTGVGRLLDVGCGAGHLVAVAEARGWDVTAQEISASGLACVRSLKRGQGLRCRIIEEDLAQADLPDGQLDVVTMIEVLEHVEDPIALLRQCSRLLRPGGCLYLTTPNYDSLSRRLLGRRWRVIAEEHRCLFSPHTLRGPLERSGLHCAQMSTRNLDVPHLLQVWRGQAGSGPHPASGESASQRLRHQVEAVSWLRSAKAAANALLRASGLGDTIELFARR